MPDTRPPNQVILVVDKTTGDSFVLLDTDARGDVVIETGPNDLIEWCSHQPGPFGFRYQKNTRP